ncbi:uncharacterized protein LOC122624077 [Drosophila teissieri]|uniref:uncharacterized protein LOC122624077 n=1 Tax=Drosophila teissieri TaxID=7243 RepID=UPI001CB9E009|nr:uncharacterized protein LOC122624077 [Drosophila teissieri]
MALAPSCSAGLQQNEEKEQKEEDQLPEHPGSSQVPSSKSWPPDPSPSSMCIGIGGARQRFHFKFKCCLHKKRAKTSKGITCPATRRRLLLVLLVPSQRNVGPKNCWNSVVTIATNGCRQQYMNEQWVHSKKLYYQTMPLNTRWFSI